MVQFVVLGTNRFLAALIQKIAATSRLENPKNRPFETKVMADLDST